MVCEKMRPVLKYPGSKWKMADWIVSLMPPHKSYLEPFFGSGAVFFRKPPSRLSKRRLRPCVPEVGLLANTAVIAWKWLKKLRWEPW